jgi:hypothetical protein
MTMLTILGAPDACGQSFCDGLSRRNFLKIGGMVMGGLSLPALLRAEEESGIGSSHKAIINVFLAGGPPHQDMWDIKTEAPAEIRGEFNPIATNVPGIEICELFPKLAAMADKLVFIRSIVGAHGGHDTNQCVYGHRLDNNSAPPGGYAAMGAWISKLQGESNVGVPPHLSLMYKTDHGPWGDPGTGGFLGMAHDPFRLVGGREEMKGTETMVLQGITAERLGDRQRLLASLDTLKRKIDTSRQMDGMDEYQKKAIGIVTTSKLADAMDLSKEDPAIVERYGKGDPKFRADGAPKMTENFLIARRLVEAGARYVSLNFSRWDWHGGNFTRGREDFPLLDGALSALVTDLHERGLDKDVSVVVWGEFGRTPKINKDAGRDHWPQVSCAVLAGGGMRTGQVIGRTNRLGEYADDRPVTFEDVFATLYKNMGINLAATREFDLRGRPQYPVLPGTQPLRELV